MAGRRKRRARRTPSAFSTLHGPTPEHEVVLDGEALYIGNSKTQARAAWKEAKRLVRQSAVWLHKGYRKAQIGAY